VSVGFGDCLKFREDVVHVSAQTVDKPVVCLAVEAVVSTIGYKAQLLHFSTETVPSKEGHFGFLEQILDLDL